MHPNIYQVWDTQTGERLFTFEFSRDVEGSAIPSQGSWIAVAYGNSAEVVDAVTGKRLFVVGENADPGYTRRIHYLAISPDGRLIAAAGRGNPFVSLWDSDTGALVFPMAGRLVGGGPLVFSPDSRLLAMACEDGVVRVWDTENYQELYMLGHRGRIDQPDSAYQVHVVAFSPDGRTLLTGGEDGTVRLWDVQSGVELAIIRVVKPDEGE